MYYCCIFMLIFTFCGAICAKDTTIYENYSSNLQCNQPNTGIFINKAQWSYDMTDVRNMVMPAAGFRNLAYAWGKAAGLCVYDEIEAVKRLCHGKKTCTITANRQTFSDACHYWMMLDISYECKPCSPRQKRGLNVDYFCDLTALLPAHQYFNGCPNSRFEAKHVCKQCRDNEVGAAMFAMQVELQRSRGDTSQTNILSVFMAPNGMTYYERGNYCSFASVATKYNCYQQGNGWTCTRQGLKIAYHNKYTGHYEPSYDNQVGFV